MSDSDESGQNKRGKSTSRGSGTDNGNGPGNLKKIKGRVIGKKKAQKQSNVRWYALGGLVTFILIVVYACTPSYGTILYGICKVYVEQNTFYPDSINILKVSERGAEVRIYYNKIDPYGQTSFNTAVCTFRQDERMGVVLDEVDFNRETEYEAENPERIAEFNTTIPVIRENPPDLKLPPRLPTNIEDYR